MIAVKKTILTRFLKDNCANYDRHYQSCLFDDSCRVFNSHRCGYFERRVLGPPDYKYKLPGYDYSKLFAQYAEQTGTQKQKVKVRRCDCGKPLQLRQRFCNECSIKRRKYSNAKYNRKRTG